MEIIVDESVKDILKRESSSIGLIIGAYSPHPLILHLAQTNNEIEESFEDSETMETDGPLKKTITVDTLSVSLLSHHVKQLLRMLPGGLDIIGIYIIEKELTIFTNKFESKIKQLLTSLNKQLNKNTFYNGKSENDKIILYFNFENKKFEIKNFSQNLIQNKLNMQFGHLEFETIKCDFDTSGVVIQQNNCNVATDNNLAETGVELKRNLNIILLQCVKECLESSLMIINGEYPSAEKIYKEQDDNVSILVAKLPAIINNNNNDDFINHLHLQGKIKAIAFVVKGDSTLNAAKNLKIDILRSLSSRMEMHCESLIDELSDETMATTKVYHEIPRRVLVKLVGKVLVSDYLFPGEGPKDSINSFKEILQNYSINENNIIDGIEPEFDLDELHHLKGSMEELLLNKAEIINPTKISNIKMFTIIVSVTMAIFAIVYAYKFK